MKLTFLIPFVFLCAQIVAQEKRFQDEIALFNRADSLAHPPKNSILFVGSSSIRFWTNLKDDFASYTVINRGFGGATFPDVINYAEDIIIPYHPKQVIIYCGENDLMSDEATAEMVARRFERLYTIIREGLPNVNIVFISIKPSPSRKAIIPKIIQANALIKKYLALKPDSYFVDIYPLMLDKKGNSRSDLFTSDKLHMNLKGYAVWKKAIEPLLLK